MSYPALQNMLDMLASGSPRGRQILFSPGALEALTAELRQVLGFSAERPPEAPPVTLEIPSLAEALATRDAHERRVAWYQERYDRLNHQEGVARRELREAKEDLGAAKFNVMHAELREGKKP